ncbi:hypothetical protein EG19_00045 [Thermoanaerobaculum aquaticum]|uniref:Decaprenyl-phosphate phosphoribosyltransferase n=1 Tax=Thermoanaerobaculum aquaticum TaxID=1312852 RepID=A0A062XW15_9BACT|nr:UbiA prenyltransferase family protein [Thermoanaerobaculum aquaticum]KDA55048.1 hypothetical protein EG19_00045 [Thermoanaerobaculum aquaticum]
MLIAPLWEAARPRQWIKNLFVFAPAVFGLRLHQPPIMLQVGLTFMSFCLASSASYLLNDVVDRHKDRDNPRTCRRPVARGALSPHLALVASGMFALAALVLSWFPGVALPVVVYLLTTGLYSLLLKKVPLLDVLSLAGLYQLRLWAGALAASVPPSPWLLTCGGFLALTLATGKRLETNRSLYPRALLRVALDSLLVLTAVSYLAYTVSRGPAHQLPHWFLLSLLPALAGLWRYRTLALRGLADPSEALFRDRLLQVAAVGWLALVLALAASGLQ